MSLLSLLVIQGCKPTNSSSFTEMEQFVLADMQRPSSIPLDETNQWDGNPKAIEFGKSLFFSHTLSPNAIACSTCHVPNLGFSDGLAQSFGADVSHCATVPHSLMSPSILGFGGTEDAIPSGRRPIGPLESPNEMNGSRTFVVGVYCSRSKPNDAIRSIVW